MAINKNHEFEDLNGIKCAIVEKKASRERADFLEQLLVYNKFEVVTIETPSAKVVPKQPTESAPESSEMDGKGTLTEPPTYTIGVTDVTFNPVNAIFGRMLKTQNNKIVTLAYWLQKEKTANDEMPYFENPALK